MKASLRLAVSEDRGAAVAVLADAFFSDSLATWTIPEGEVRRRFQEGMFRATFDDALANGELRVAEDSRDVRGVAISYPPGRQSDVRGSDMDADRGALSEPDRDRLAIVHERLARHQPDEPHCYVSLMAVSTVDQGRGIGSSLLSSVLATCDREAAATYLVATCEDNRRLYERYGFETVASVSLPDGPSCFPMWRAPRQES